MDQQRYKIVVAQMSFVLLWSSGFVGAKLGLDHAGIFSLLFLRYALVAIVLMSIVVFAYAAQRIDWPTIMQQLMIGLLAHGLYLSTMLMAFALGATAGTAALIGGFQPILTGLAARQMLSERTTLKQWFGIFTGFIALSLVTFNGLSIGGKPTAYALLFTSVGCITVASLHQRWLDTRADVGQPPLIVKLSLQCTASAIALSVPAWWFEDIAFSWEPSPVGVLLWLSLSVSLGGFGVYWYLVQRCPVTQVASLVYFTVPVTMILSFLIFGDTLTPLGILGLVLAAVGVWLAHTRGPEDADNAGSGEE